MTGLPLENESRLSIAKYNASEVMQRRTKIRFTEEERQSYIEAIKPFVEHAKETYNPLRPYVQQLNLLRQQQGQLEIQREQAGQPIVRHPLNAALAGIKMSIAAIEDSEEYKVAKENFRIAANQLIAEVNKHHNQVAVSREIIDPRATQLTTRPQIPFPQVKNRFSRPDSPTKPHNALETLPNYRQRKIPYQVSAAVSEVAVRVSPQDRGFRDMSLSLTFLVPENLIPTKSLGVPSYLRNPENFASEVVSVSKLVESYSSGALQTPTESELGLRGIHQDEHVKTYLSALLAHFIQEELVQPARTEKELQDSYQQFCDYIRKMTRHITPANGLQDDSYEKVGKLIEDMPGIQGVMVSSRLSTNLFMDLYLPCLDQISEIRIAEVLRNISQSAKYKKDLGRYGFQEEHRFLFEKIICALEERLGEDELNAYKLFEAIDSTGYGDLIVERLFQLADYEQKAVLRETLAYSGLFPQFLRYKDDDYGLSDED